jgi:hypothetical protein
MTDQIEEIKSPDIPLSEITPEKIKALSGMIYQSIDKMSHGDPERRMELLIHAKEFYEEKFPGTSFQDLVDKAPPFVGEKQPA